MVVTKVSTFECITQHFANQLAERLKHFEAIESKNPATVLQVKKSILDDFVFRSLVALWAADNNVSLTPEELKSETDRIRGEYPDDLAMRRNLANEHLSFEQWQGNLKHNLLQQKVFKKLRETRVRPDEKRMQDFYRDNRSLFMQSAQIRIRQVVTDREDKALMLQKKTKEGATLKELSVYSNGPEAKNGGETGWIDISTLEIFAAASKLPIGVKSGVLKSPFGFHLLEVLEKRAPGPQPYDAVKEKIAKLILENEERELYSAWLDEQIRKYHVYKNEKVVAAITVHTEEN